MARSDDGPASSAESPRDPSRDPPRDPPGEHGFRQAKDVCLRQLAARARSRGELEATLARKGFAEDIIEQVLGKVEAAGLINDADFAETWVRSRHTHQGLGRRVLHAELVRKGVAKEVADAAVADVDDEAEKDRARALVRKRLSSLDRVDETTAFRRLVAMLARKGYSEGLSYAVASEELGADHDRTV